MSDWCPENDGAYRAEMAAMYPVANRKRIEELEAKLAEEIRISNLRGNMIEFQLLPDLHDTRAKLAKAVKLIELAIELGRWELNQSFRDELIAFTTELTGGNDE